MNFLHNDLGILDGHETVEVTLSSSANVRLMDSSNFTHTGTAADTATTAAT